MSPFILDLTASFFVGGTLVMAASLAAQHLGGRVGGFIAGLPATAVLSILFITVTEGAVHAHEVTTAFTLAISINAVFLAVFGAFSTRSFSCGLLTSLAVWTLAQSVLLYFHPVRYGLVFTLGLVLFLISILFVNRLDTPDPICRPVRHGIVEIAVRAFFGGGIIVLSMVGSRYGGPGLGGILSAFPATVVATLVITNVYGGKDLTRVMVRPMMVSGVVNCIVFAVLYRQVVLEMPVWGALAAAYAGTMASASCTYYWLSARSREHGSTAHT